MNTHPVSIQLWISSYYSSLKSKLNTKKLTFYGMHSPVAQLPQVFRLIYLSISCFYCASQVLQINKENLPAFYNQCIARTFKCTAFQLPGLGRPPMLRKICWKIVRIHHVQVKTTAYHYYIPSCSTQSDGETLKPILIILNFSTYPNFYMNFRTTAHMF